ncbi:MAG: hypothetical protein IJA15_05810 [Clostridia bacterium]|nr:hypothetical protein [Clostridia bacterium]
MSFFSNFSSDRCPSQITGNPINGLCEKVCVQAKKVFDACIKQTQEEGIVLTLTNLTPENPTYPLTFVSAKSTSTKGTITSLQVDRLTDRPNFARVQVTTTVPLEVIYTDANGVEGSATSSTTLTSDVILYVPEPSIIPYYIEAGVSIIAPEGVFDTTNNTFTVSCCVTVILKVLMEVELLVPSYGYATIPPCQEYTQEVCSGFFELPLFPNNN